jgi:hypothetical protein
MQWYIEVGPLGSDEVMGGGMDGIIPLYKKHQIAALLTPPCEEIAARMCLTGGIKMTLTKP